MQNTPTRRNFLKTLGVLGVAAYAGCAVPKAAETSNLEVLLGEANAFSEKQLTFEELQKAAKYAIALSDYKGSDLKGKEKAVEETKNKMAKIVHYGLDKGEGSVYVCLNLLRDVQGGTANKGRELETNVTTKLLAADLYAKPNEHVYFNQQDVLELVANSTQSYVRMPEHVISAAEVKQRGYKIIRETSQIGKMLGAGNFTDVRCGETFTAKDHAAYGGDKFEKVDYKQGAYVKQMPAAVRLVVKKTPEYAKAVEK
jgi:hypothetical protein